jgi:hypothetical protein
MNKMAALVAACVGLILSGGVQAADIDVQRNQPALINGVLYPISGNPLVLPNMEVVLAAFPTPRSEVNAVANLSEHSAVKVIVIDMMIDANADAIAKARVDNREDIDRLLAAIAANTQFRIDLESHDVIIKTVLAADIGADGVLVLYALA